MKSKIFIFACAITLGSIYLAACRRGEQDPFISLRSRDARLTGKWKLASIEGTEVHPEYTIFTTFNGSNLSIIKNNDTISKSYRESFEIFKDGRYDLTILDDTLNFQETADWYWLNSDQNKTELAIKGGVYNVDGLSNKKLILSVYNKITTTSTIEHSFKYTYEKEN